MAIERIRVPDKTFGMLVKYVDKASSMSISLRAEDHIEFIECHGLSRRVMSESELKHWNLLPTVGEAGRRIMKDDGTFGTWHIYLK